MSQTDRIKMKKNSKIAISAAATLLAGVAVASLPAAAHDNGASSRPTSSQKADHAHATVSATITGIPEAVTSSHEASHGAYFTVYQLSASATSAPATQPTEGGNRIGVRPERGAAVPAINGSTLTATLGFHADVAGTSKYALYPSDGSAAILVTVSVSDTGTATVSSSRPITVAYSATVAAEHPVRNHDEAGHGKRDSDKRDGGKGHRGKGHGPRH
jgi:hypothetical protein